MQSPTQRARFLFEDREGNKSRVDLYLPLSISGPSLIPALNVLYSRLLPLTNASIIGVKVSRDIEFDNPNEASLDSDITKKVALFYRNASIYEAIYVPSPLSTIFEDSGKFAGIRVDRTLPSLVPLTTDSASSLSLLVTPEGETFPTEYAVGGLVL